MSALTHAEGDWRWAASSCRNPACGPWLPAARRPEPSLLVAPVGHLVGYHDRGACDAAPKRGEEGAEQRKGWL